MLYPLSYGRVAEWPRLLYKRARLPLESAGRREETGRG
jgi:hypothetical protein